MKRVVAALGLFLIAVCAHAEINVRASIGGLNFELIDLDLSDGVSPSITFGRVYGYGSNFLDAEEFHESQNISFSGAFREIIRAVR